MAVFEESGKRILITSTKVTIRYVRSLLVLAIVGANDAVEI